MFKYDAVQAGERVDVILDGRPMSLPSATSVAAALLAEGITISRTSPTSGKPCSPHCLMGVCYECMMEINGVQRQACMTPVEDGMVINRHLDEEASNEPVS